MNFCQDHWGRLRKAIDERGLGHLVAPDGETAAAQMAAQLTSEDGKSTPASAADG